VLGGGGGESWWRSRWSNGRHGAAVSVVVVRGLVSAMVPQVWVGWVAENDSAVRQHGYRRNHEEG
jgi:hypothetical protein